MGEQHRQCRLPFQDAHGDFEFYARDLPLCAPLLYPSVSAREAIQQLPLEPALQRTALQQERRLARLDFGFDEVRPRVSTPARGLCKDLSKKSDKLLRPLRRESSRKLVV